MADTAKVTYPGLSLRGCTFPFSRGVTPSSGTMYVLPFDGLNLDPGTLSFTYGGIAVNFQNVAISTAFIRKQYDGKWPIWAVTFFDRRWTWAGKAVSGDWNRRLSDGTVDPVTQKTPADMATLIGQALGENIDTSRMPSGVYPRFLLKNQRADLALAALCDYVACEVAMNWQSNQVEIWPLGVGATTPTGAFELLPKYRYQSRTGTPSTIEVVGGDSLFQTKLKLSAVGTESTGQQKLINNLGFGATWSTESPFGFPGITGTTNQTDAFVELWRSFRVVGQQDGSLSVPNCQENITSVEQYLLNDYLLDTGTDLAGYKKNLPCYIDGDYWSYTDLPTNASSQRYTGDFKLSADLRMTFFPFPIFKLDSSGAYQEPALYLNTSYRVKSTSDQPVRIKRSTSLGGSGGTLSLKRPELYAAYNSVSGLNTEAAANTEADRYLQIFTQKFGSGMASEIRYPGLQSWTLDGVISQITWSWSVNREPFTEVCEREELNTSAIDRNTRRRREQLAQIVEQYL